MAWKSERRPAEVPPGEREDIPRTLGPIRAPLPVRRDGTGRAKLSERRAGTRDEWSEHALHHFHRQYLEHMTARSDNP